MPCVAYRELAGPHRRRARRAHAHSWFAEPERRDPLHRLRLPLGVRQDQPRHADSTRLAARVEGFHGRRRHRLATSGRRWRIHPESGYFGVGPGTNPETNRNAYNMIRRDTLFTNVALTADNEPWWEGLSTGKPVIDWQGRAYDPARGPAAHPNSRFTVSARQNPSYSHRSEDPQGVPITALVFGGRRREVAPLVYEARDWNHGVLVGASVASETTAAMVGQVGVVRRDPMAMQPFCGYNFGDYWQHWLDVGSKLTRPPGIYHVNWFRRDADGKFLWPGYGENLRVLEWVLNRCAGDVGATETPIGRLPRAADLNTKGLNVSADALRALLSVDPSLWKKEMSEIRTYLEQYGNRLPAEMIQELEGTESRLA